MKAMGMARLGREAEMRAMSDGTPVLNLALAVNYGKKGQDGNRPTQWIDAAMYGTRAETLAPFMLKGSAHCFTLSDMHVETYQKNDGSGLGFKLAARIDDVELGPRRDGPAPQQQQQPQQRQAPAQQQHQAPAPRPQAARPPAPAQSSSGFDDMSDDIPF